MGGLFGKIKMTLPTHKPFYIPKNEWEHHLWFMKMYADEDYIYCAEKLLSEDAVDIWVKVPEYSTGMFIEGIAACYFSLTDLDREIKEENSLRNTKTPIFGTIDKLCNLLGNLKYHYHAIQFIKDHQLIKNLQDLRLMIENSDGNSEFVAMSDNGAMYYVLNFSRERKKSRHLDFMRRLVFSYIEELKLDYHNKDVRKDLAYFVFEIAQVIFSDNDDFPAYDNKQLEKSVFDIQLMEKIFHGLYLE